MSGVGKIAIVGIGCRLPGADTVAGFDALLRRGGTALAQTSAPQGAPCAGRLSDTDGFDTAPFGISKSEAPLIDPLQRLFLEASWHALEDAGLSPGRLAGGEIGVFAGVGPSEYALLQAGAGFPARHNPYQNLGVSAGAVSGRVAYCLGLTGPAQTVDCACASGLVAMASAADALTLGHCDLALAGAVNILLDPAVMDSLTASGVLSDRGENRSFDVAADGFVRGEGCVVFALRPLAEAEARGDHILAVMSGWGHRQNGRTNGMMASSSAAQVAGMRRVLERAGLTPSEVGFVEGHGSATKLGDQMELAALAELFGDRDGSAEPLCVGSVKANIGHLEAAAGAAGAAKVALMLDRGFIAAQPSFDRMADAGRPFCVPKQTQAWSGAGRHALVAALGFNGTCAHVLLSAAAPRVLNGTQDKAKAMAGPGVFLMSAASPPALRARVAGLHAMLADTDSDIDPDIASLGRAVSLRWDGLPYRIAFVATDARDLRRQMQDWTSADAVPPRVRGGQVAGLTGLPFDAETLRAAFPELQPPGDGAEGFCQWARQLGISLRATPAALTLSGIPSAPEGRSAVLTAIAELWRAGVEVDPRRLCRGGDAAAPPRLPPYPFQRRPMWFDTVRASPSKPGAGGT